MKVKAVMTRIETGPGSNQVEVLIQQLLDFIVKTNIFDFTAVDAYEVMVVRQQRLGQLEVGVAAAAGYAFDNTALL